MRIVVIGATGHIGSYLVPRLLAGGHEVVAVSRGVREPYLDAPEWARVERIVLDRQAEEARGTFGSSIAELRPDVVVDLICFRLGSAEQLTEALRGRIQHLLHCGTLWVHGLSEVVPTVETAPRRPFGAYGIAKAEIEAYLLREARTRGVPATVLHPGHIVGQGWMPIGPAGNLNGIVFERLACGEPVALPDRGLTTLHHVHADDVAQAFERAIGAWSHAVGEAFHVVSPAAITLLGYAREVARWFGREAQVEFLPWAEWRETVSAEDARLTEDHLAHSPCASIAKARRSLGYQPRYSSFEALRESLSGLIRSGKITGPALDPIG